MPEAELLLRIYANDDSALISFGEKFGAPIDCTEILLSRARELGLRVMGVSFHVGEYESNIHLILIFRSSPYELYAINRKTSLYTNYHPHWQEPEPKTPKHSATPSTTPE